MAQSPGFGTGRPSDVGRGTIAGWPIGNLELLRYNNIVDDPTPPPAPDIRGVGTVERNDGRFQ